ncbi:MAG: SpoVG family protein [Candidatus Nomurabacteria bacterium]|nr:SpoVG family protein [Candidatus Nomurabacteria bacterium]
MYEDNRSNVAPVKPRDGLIGFASVVVEDSIYLNSIAIYTKLDGTYRLLYPTKTSGERTINIFHPINRATSQKIEEAIFKKCNEIFESSNDDRYDQV